MCKGQTAIRTFIFIVILTGIVLVSAQYGYIFADIDNAHVCFAYVSQ
jgi:hypothetical protein